MKPKFTNSTRSHETIYTNDMQARLWRLTTARNDALMTMYSENPRFAERAQPAAPRPVAETAQTPVVAAKHLPEQVDVLGLVDREVQRADTQLSAEMTQKQLDAQQLIDAAFENTTAPTVPTNEDDHEYPLAA